MLWNVEPRRGHGDLCRCRGVGFFYVLWLPTQHYLLVVVAARQGTETGDGYRC